MEKKKRKYGEVRRGEEIVADSSQSVFDKFFSNPLTQEISEIPRPQYAPPPLSARGASDAPGTQGAPHAQNTPYPVHRARGAQDAPRPQYERGLELPANSPHLRFAYEVLDYALAKLDPYPRVVLLRLYRLSAGWNTSTVKVSLNKLGEHCKIKRTKVRNCLRELEREGYIKQIDVDVSHKNSDERGMTYEVLLPRMAHTQRAPGAQYARGAQDAPRAQYGPNKEKLLKENNKRENELTLDTKSCPDCSGTGYWYPEGIEKGVAKCKHERMHEGKQNRASD
jgi:DNA-binding Lrp family transcriptional regulator